MIFKHIICRLRKKDDKYFKKLGICLLLSYYLIGLCSYITATIPKVSQLFVSSSIFAIVLRAIMIVSICLYSYFLCKTKHIKFRYEWLFIFGILLICTGFCILLSPLRYEYVYVEPLYGIVHQISLSAGIPKNLIMYFSSIADFAFAFCALFILPFIVNDKKTILVLLTPIIFICWIECFYSIIVEKNNYIYLFTHPDDIFGGYTNNIGASFGNKEDWGAFLALSFTSSLTSCFLFKHNTNKTKLYFAFLIVSSLCFAGFAILSLCKTAVLGILLSTVVYTIAFVYFTWKKSITKGIVFVSIISILVLLAILFFTVDAFHSKGLFKKIYEFVNNFFISKVGNALEGRMILWLRFIENVRGFNFFFGMGKANTLIYTRTLTNEGQSAMHNGFFYFLGCYGVIGASILVSLFIIIFRNIVKLWKIDKKMVFVCFAALLTCLCFVLAEAEVLIISSSIPIFMYNVLLVMFPIGYYIKQKKEMKVIEYEKCI